MQFFRLLLHVRAHGSAPHHGGGHSDNEGLGGGAVVLLQPAATDHVPQHPDQAERVVGAAVYPTRFARAVSQDRRVHRGILLGAAQHRPHRQLLPRVDAASGAPAVSQQRVEVLQRREADHILLAVRDRHG